MKFIYAISFLVFFSCNTFSQENNIWGIWNIGNRDDARIITYEDGTFLTSREFLSFDSNYYGNGPRFSEQGYHYRIKEIINNKGKNVFLYVETKIQIRKEDRWADIWINAKIIMHFIDQNHMWIEIDFSDEQYPTDPKFEKNRWFAGSSVVFWRERVLSIN